MLELEEAGKVEEIRKSLKNGVQRWGHIKRTETLHVSYFCLRHRLVRMHVNGVGIGDLLFMRNEAGTITATDRFLVCGIQAINQGSIGCIS